MFHQKWNKKNHAKTSNRADYRFSWTQQQVIFTKIRMNSFFYGNPFGPNAFFFPYAAAKTSPFINFEDCTFNIEKN